MVLIAVAADKGAPGVTTASLALAAVWPRPVLLAECDPSGGDVAYWLPGPGGERLDPRSGLLSLAVAARRGLLPLQVWEHAQKLHGGLDVLLGVGSAEQGAGVELLWGTVGRLLAAVPQADVVADCGRLGADGPVYDLLAHASMIILLCRATVGEVIRLRDRVSAVAAALAKRGRPGVVSGVVVVAEYKGFGPAVAQVAQVLRQSGAPARVLGGIAFEPRSAEQLRGEWNGKLDKSMFIRTARAVVGDLVTGLPQPEAPPAAKGRHASGPAESAVPARGQVRAADQDEGQREDEVRAAGHDDEIRAAGHNEIRAAGHKEIQAAGPGEIQAGARDEVPDEAQAAGHDDEFRAAEEDEGQDQDVGGQAVERIGH